MYLITCSWLCPSKLLREGDSIKFLQNKHWRSSGQKSNEPVEEALFPLPRMHAFPKLPFQIRVVAHLQTRGPPWNIDCALSSLLVLLLFPSLVTSPLSPKLPLLVTGWLAGSALLSWKAGNSWQLGPEMTALPAVAAPCRSEYLAALAPHAAHAASRAHLAHLSGPCVFVYMCLTPVRSVHLITSVTDSGRSVTGGWSGRGGQGPAGTALHTASYSRTDRPRYHVLVSASTHRLYLGYLGKVVAVRSPPRFAMRTFSALRAAAARRVPLSTEYFAWGGEIHFHGPGP